MTPLWRDTGVAVESHASIGTPDAAKHATGAVGFVFELGEERPGQAHVRDSSGAWMHEARPGSMATQASRT